MPILVCHTLYYTFLYPWMRYFYKKDRHKYRINNGRENNGLCRAHRVIQSSHDPSRQSLQASSLRRMTGHFLHTAGPLIPHYNWCTAFEYAKNLLATSTRARG
jgi:hypothetical protein